MIRLGMLDFDTSHCVEFTRRLNHKNITRSHWVDGARVVIACAGESAMTPERIPGFRDEMVQMGVPLVDDPVEMIGKVDGMLIESLDGSVHLDRAKPFLDAGIPCFIDKPFTCSVAQAKKIAALAARKKTPIFSSSSLRYAPELITFKSDPNRGDIIGVVSYGPAPYFPSPDGSRNPGLFHYGIHATEALFALMGPGCVQISCTHEAGVDVVTGQWKDGRLATMRGIRDGKAEYGFLAFTQTGVEHVRMQTRYIYRELLKQVVTFFQTKVAPVDISETIEIMAFLEAALRSASSKGGVEKLK